MMESSIQAWKKYELDCQCLNSFSSGNVALKQKLLELLPSRSSQEIKLVRQSYSAIYNKDILHVLSNIRRNDPFANVVYLRINEAHERDAEIIRDSLFGWSKMNLNVLIEVVCTRSSAELYSIKQAYRTCYGSNVEKDISQKISGNFKEILLAVLKSSNKYSSRVDMSMAMCDAKTLYEAVESGNSVDWKSIISILSDRNRGQIKAIFLSYKDLYGHEFSRFLKCNKCGNFGKDLRFVIRGIQFPAKFFSKQLRGAMQRGDTKEVMARIMITRLEDDIKEINNVFAAKTGWSVGNLIRREFKDAGSQKNSSNALMAEFLLGLLKCR